MNKLFAIALSIVLSLPIMVWAVDETVSINSIEQPEVVNQLDEDIEEVKESDFKQPADIKKLSKKFLAAMGGVGISSLAIFVMLTMYNRIRERFANPVKTLDGETTLETPDDLDSAVKTFLDKTRW